MANSLPDADLELRLDELTQRIARLKAELADGLETETFAHMLALGAILHRHGDIAVAARSMPARVRHRARDALADLAADLKGLEDALHSWIASIDEKQRH